MDLNVRAKIVEVLEENVGKNHYNLSLGIDFFNKHQKHR